MGDTIPAPAPPITRWHLKAQAAHVGWSSVLGVAPSLHAIVLFLAVAEHETRCGDAWPGEHNWGACQKRRLTTEEKAAVSAIAPSPKTVELARAQLFAAGLPPDHEALHVDSSPGKGWYWVYFWAYPDDDGGAGLLAKVLARQRPGCRAILDDSHGSAQSLAAAMYRSGYYEGFHDPKLPGGADANIADYGGALVRLVPGIERALAGWEPAPPEWRPSDEDRAAQVAAMVLPDPWEDRGGGTADPLYHDPEDDTA